MVSGPSSLPLAVSMGEPAGIGVEIVARAWQALVPEGGRTFYLLGSADFIAARLARLGLAVPLAVVEPEAAVDTFRTALPVVALSGASPEDRPGELSASSAAVTIEAIASAVRHVQAGRAAGIVTAPIQKSNLYAAGFAFPGHTEYLGALAAELWPQAAPCRPVMMLAGPELRTVPVTVHIPLQAVPGHLATADIVEIGIIAHRELRQRFGIPRPRIAIAGLNPHAGEAGTMGSEDGAVIAPAVAQLQAAGIDATGPWPADTMFHARARATYDVVLAMYHDQALIPVKTIAFDETVNVTLGLPFIRTSPDHGTALGIAAHGVANPASMIAAIRMAADMAARSGAA